MRWLLEDGLPFSKAADKALKEVYGSLCSCGYQLAVASLYYDVSLGSSYLFNRT